MRLKKFNESYGKDYTFETKIDNRLGIEINASIIAKDNGIDEVDYITTKCVVYWDYELSIGRYGIESILPTISKIVLDVTAEFTTDKEGDVYEELELSYEYNIMNSDIEIEYSNGVKLPFLPTEITIENTLLVDGEIKPKIIVDFNE